MNKSRQYFPLDQSQTAILFHYQDKKSTIISEYQNVKSDQGLAKLIISDPNLRSESLYSELIKHHHTLIDSKPFRKWFEVKRQVSGVNSVLLGNPTEYVPTDQEIIKHLYHQHLSPIQILSDLKQIKGFELRSDHQTLNP